MARRWSWKTIWLASRSFPGTFASGCDARRFPLEFVILGHEALCGGALLPGGGSDDRLPALAEQRNRPRARYPRGPARERYRRRLCRAVENGHRAERLGLVG